MAISAEEWAERSRQAVVRYWAEVTPEQLAERRRRAAETRARNKVRREEHGARQRREDQKRRDSLARRSARAKERRQQAAAIEKAAAVEAFLARTSPLPGATYFDIDSRKHTVVVSGWVGIEDRYIAARWGDFWAYVDTTGGPDACCPRSFETPHFC